MLNGIYYIEVGDIMLKEYKIKNMNYEIKLQIIRSKRKSIGIEFHLSKGIKLRIPNEMKDYAIVAFINANEELIITKYVQAISNQKQIPKHTWEDIYVNGGKLPYLSQEVTIVITSEIKFTPKKNIKNLNTTAYVYFLEDEDANKTLRIETLVSDIAFLRECVVNRYKEQAKQLFNAKVKEHAEIMKVSYGNISVKEQKTRWGSCSSLKNLNFNWKLIMMPEPIVTYVIVHELAHLKFMDHSKNFWTEVEKYLPDYRISKNWLEKNGIHFQMY